MGSRERSNASLATRLPSLTVIMAKDGARFMAQCPQLDLVTEMDREPDAVSAMVEMIQEYAEDYRKRIKEYSTSSNRAHHRPYVDRIAECRNSAEIRAQLELKGVIA